MCRSCTLSSVLNCLVLLYDIVPLDCKIQCTRGGWSWMFWARKWCSQYATAQKLSEHHECNFISYCVVSTKGCVGNYCPTYTLYIMERVISFRVAECHPAPVCGNIFWGVLDKSIVGGVFNFCSRVLSHIQRCLQRGSCPYLISGIIVGRPPIIP